MKNVIETAILNKTSLPKLQRMLDLSSFRHKLIVSNVANVTTPGYKSKSIDFDGELKKAIAPRKGRMDVTHPRHIPLKSHRDSPPEVKEKKLDEDSNGVNSVDIDKEMAELAQNSLAYELAAELAGNKFKAVKSAIRGKVI
jgi:flagellar basal-body rod protein FlgB